MKWRESYLWNRSQFVTYNNSVSSTKDITCGVPQGSILGPLLFLLYVNDIVNVSNVLLPIVFADDTNVFLEGTNIDHMCALMNKELEKLCNWLHANKLSLNVEKTQFILFTKREKCVVSSPIKIFDVSIVEVNSVKFLGVLIDCHLNWSDHIKLIKNKIAKGIGIICKAKKILKPETLKTLYNSFILPHLTYCIEVWGATFDCILDKLNILHKKSVRIMMSQQRLSHTDPLFKRLGLLKLSQIYMYAITVFMFKYQRGLLPDIFNDLFVYNSSIHGHATRQNNLLHVPVSKSLVLSRSIRIKGVSIWNNLSKLVNHDCSFGKYKYDLKQYLLYNDMCI